MNRPCTLAVCAFCFLSLAAAAVAQDRFPSPAGFTAASLLERVHLAAGGATWRAVGAIKMFGVETSAGGTGRWEALDDVQHGWMRRSSNFGLLRYSEVWGPKGRWRVDPGDGVHPIDSDYSRSAAMTDEWLARRDYLKMGAVGAVMGAPSVTHEKDRSFVTVTATPQGGQSVDLWFDANTYLLDRLIRRLPRYVEITRFLDYRTIGGLMLPHIIATDSGDPTDIDTVKIARYIVLATPPSKSFGQPNTVKDWHLAASSVTVPMEFDGEVVINVMLNGQGPFPFLWDTGGHDILTNDTAAKLGLIGSGSNSLGGTGAGTVSAQFTKVSTVQIGRLRLSDQTFSIVALDHSIVERGERPPLAGILGPELCERLRVTLNYQAGTIAFRPFGHLASSHQGTAIPITFTDDMPLVHAAVDDKGGDFAVDTGNGGPLIILQRWAQNNGLAERLRAGTEGTSMGLGGSSREWSSSADSFILADTTLRNVPVRYSEDERGSLSSQTEAGNLGNSILSNFIVEFDYSQGYIYLLPAVSSLHP